MSLVGTRPPTLDEWEKYELHHRARLAIKPGITGMWQVSGRSDITDFEEVVKLDMDILMDLRPDVDFENEKKLIGDGILESFDIMSLVAELEDEFEVKIKPKDLVAENFNSVDDMVAMLKKLGA